MGYDDKWTILDVIKALRPDQAEDATAIDRADYRERRQEAVYEKARGLAKKDTKYGEWTDRQLRDGAHIPHEYRKEARKLIPNVLPEDQKEAQIRSEKALSENLELPEGGTFERGTYYSNILPKGQDQTPWNKEAATIIRNAAQHNATRSDIFKAQEYFASIGYMHESEIDGYKGPQLQGMIKRWGLNAGASSEAVKDAIRDFKIFD